MVAQTQSLRTNVSKQELTKVLRMSCEEFVNSWKRPWIILLVDVQSLLKKSKEDYTIVVRALHWDLCQIHEIQTTRNGMNTGLKELWRYIAKILWGFTLQTDNDVQARRLDIVIP